MNKIKFALASGTVLSLAFTAILTFAPSSVSAQVAPIDESGGGEGPIYSAGNLRPGTQICRCGSVTGNCVCEISQ